MKGKELRYQSRLLLDVPCRRKKSEFEDCVGFPEEQIGKETERRTFRSDARKIFLAEKKGGQEIPREGRLTPTLGSISKLQCCKTKLQKRDVKKVQIGGEQATVLRFFLEKKYIK